MTGQTDEENNCRFYDRLALFHRRKQNGQWISRGGELSEVGSVVLRIKEGKRGSFLTAHLGQLLVLNANIRDDPNVINSVTVILSLEDYSGQTPIKRDFKLRFFDERSCRSFISIYKRTLHEWKLSSKQTTEDKIANFELSSSDNDSILQHNTATTKKKEHLKVSVCSSDDETSSSDEEEEKNLSRSSVEDESSLISPFNDDFGLSQDLYEPARRFNKDSFRF